MNMTIKKELKVKELQKNMTIKFLKLIDDWKKYKIHPLPCICPLCLWRKYESKIGRKKSFMRGRPYDMITFFIWDLIFDAKEVQLLEIGKAKIIKKNEKTVLVYNMIDHHNAPYIERVKQVLSESPEFGQYTKYYLNKLTKEYFGKYAKNKRYERSNFLKLLSNLESEIHKEWQEKHPESPKKRKEWARNWKDLRLAQRIANYIHSQPGKLIKRRLLLRHFNIKVEDLDVIRDLLPNFGINYKEKIGYRNKTTIYYSNAKSSKGRYWGMEL